jgi:AmmeMemoRadiSam system protein B
MSNYEIVPILLGEISPDYLSKILAPYFDREDSIFVVSSDLSHYRPYEEAQKIDAKTLKIITELDLENEMEIDACGSYGIKVIMRLAKQSACQIKLLNYRNSGDTAGDKSAVVGYASLAVIKP